MEYESISTTRVGAFRVFRRLASGATTDVLLARAEGSDRVVALKILLQQFRSDPAFEQAFVREASAYAGLSHPAIVKLYDFFAVDGQFVMVLEYVDGLPLHKLRAMLSIGGEKVEDSAALFIASRIFEALAAAHSARDPGTGEFAPVIHRDINPSNVLVPWAADVKVSDFGIAKAGGTQADTKMGFVKGTYGYLAPEQVKGESVTVRADIYAASLLLWELLARRKAIQRGAMSEVGVLKAMMQPEFPSLAIVRPDVDRDVCDAVGRGLAVNPDERSITAAEMVEILAGAMKADDGRATLARAIARVRPSPSEVNGSIPPSPSPSTSRLIVAPAVSPQGVNEAPILDPPMRTPTWVHGPAPAPPPASTRAPTPGPNPTPARSSSPALVPAPPRSSSPALVPTSAPAPVDVQPEPTPAVPVASPAVVATAAPAHASAPRPVTGPSRAGTPRRDLALVVVLLSALGGVAIVAFCLWSQEGTRPTSVVASPTASSTATGPRPADPSPSATPPAAVTAAALASGGASPSAMAPSPPVVPPDASIAPALAAPALPSSAPTSAPANASSRTAKPAGTDPEAAAAGLGDIFTAASAGGHRVFVDGKVVGQSPDPIHVRCGKHDVRIGGNGIAQTIDIPCGGSILVNPKRGPPSDSAP